jgi:hypothetical protein
MQFAPGYEFNVFDLQVGCEYPLPLERAFLQNFLALITLPPDQSTPFEGMGQMIGIVIDEAIACALTFQGHRRSAIAGMWSRWSTQRSKNTRSK